MAKPGVNGSLKAVNGFFRIGTYFLRALAVLPIVLDEIVDIVIGALCPADVRATRELQDFALSQWRRFRSTKTPAFKGKKTPLQEKMARKSFEKVEAAWNGIVSSLMRRWME